MIQKAVADFNSKRAFSNNSVNKNICFFRETLKMYSVHTQRKNKN